MSKIYSPFSKHGVPALTGLFIDPLTNKWNLIIIAIKTASYIIIYRLLNVILYFP